MTTTLTETIPAAELGWRTGLPAAGAGPLPLGDVAAVAAETYRVLARGTLADLVGAPA